jgi:hypothetical protein
MKKSIQEVFRGAACEFVDMAANRAGGNGVPVQTGMAKGAFRANVQRFSGATGTMETYIGADVPISPTRNQTGKTPESGAAASEFIFHMSKKGRRYTFSFVTDVFHFLLNEFNAMGYGTKRKSTPWYVLTAGKLAFENYIGEHLKSNIPNIKDYIFEDDAI